MKICKGKHFVAVLFSGACTCVLVPVGTWRPEQGTRFLRAGVTSTLGETNLLCQCWDPDSCPHSDFTASTLNPWASHQQWESLFNAANHVL